MQFVNSCVVTRYGSSVWWRLTLKYLTFHEDAMTFDRHCELDSFMQISPSIVVFLNGLLVIWWIIWWCSTLSLCSFVTTSTFRLSPSWPYYGLQWYLPWSFNIIYIAFQNFSIFLLPISIFLLLRFLYIPTSKFFSINYSIFNIH